MPQLQKIACFVKCQHKHSLDFCIQSQKWRLSAAQQSSRLCRCGVVYPIRLRSKSTLRLYCCFLQIRSSLAGKAAVASGCILNLAAHLYPSTEERVNLRSAVSTSATGHRLAPPFSATRRTAGTDTHVQLSSFSHMEGKYVPAFSVRLAQQEDTVIKELFLFGK